MYVDVKQIKIKTSLEGLSMLNALMCSVQTSRTSKLACSIFWDLANKIAKKMLPLHPQDRRTHTLKLKYHEAYLLLQLLLDSSYPTQSYHVALYAQLTTQLDQQLL